MPGGLQLSAAEGESESDLSTKKREKVMSKRAKAVCVKCNTHDGLFVMLRNGERLPSYTIKIGEGIVCNACKGESK